LNILLAALGLEQKELATLMGYDKAYVVNVFNGHTVARPAFRRALGETIGSLILGTYEPASAERYPAAPLLSVIQNRAADAPCKRDFYRKLGVNVSIHNRETLDALLVDRVCCSLGIHPTSVYGHDYELEAS
jgi:hypothetical protein